MVSIFDSHLLFYLSDFVILLDPVTTTFMVLQAFNHNFKGVVPILILHFTPILHSHHSTPLLAIIQLLLLQPWYFHLRLPLCLSNNCYQVFLPHPLHCYGRYVASFCAIATKLFSCEALDLNNVSITGFIAVAQRLSAVERIKQQGAEFVVQSSLFDGAHES